MPQQAPRELLRRAASAVVPDAGKRAIDRVLERRFLRHVGPINDEYVARYGLRVRRGPFEGMLYAPGQEHISGHLIAKLVGAYERQIYPWLWDEWIGASFDLVIDVGCAEGFYAVGLARAMPRTRVRAYDIYEPAREYCVRLASANAVDDRVEVAGECTPATLAAVEERRVALLSDCEGYEKTLLDPQLVPSLRNWSIIVEQHDLLDPTISATLARRFVDTHEIETVEYVTPPSDVAPELEWLTDAQRRMVLDERPVSMTWALLRPRTPPSA